METNTVKGPVYYILFTYPGQLRVAVLHGETNNVIVAEEGNQHHLVMMAEKLKTDGLIADYRLVKEVA
jgi:hypothetical protein